MQCRLVLVAVVCWCTLASGADWPRATPAKAGLDESQLALARDYALQAGGSGYVIYRGQLVYSWGDPARKFDLKSTSKSIGVTALGLAIADGKLSLDTTLDDCVPDSAGEPDAAPAGWRERVTLLQLATQSAGFDKHGGFSPLLFEPGERWSYSDAGPNWLADCITSTYDRDVEDLLFERVFSNLGITSDDLHWRAHQYRPQKLGGIPRREFGSGVHANVDAMARIGQLYLQGGEWAGEQLLPSDFVEQARRPIPEITSLPVSQSDEYPGAARHYGLLWWNNGDGTIKGIPRDAYWSWGLYDSLIVVIPSLDLVAARAGKSFAGEWSGGYDKLVPFLRPLVRAIGAAYRPHPRLTLAWDAPDSVIRLAEGSDNWPSTWADDGALYTAYGDGWGFEPKVDRKLSLGLARVDGEPPSLRANNIRSLTGERIGQGPAGVKASGMLMAGGVLYMLARNADNSQIAWSSDHGETWEWADWRFTESFGAPAFLQFGKNYSGARDDFVYAYSQDADSAYDSADALVLARAPRNLLRDRSAWKFFSGAEGAGQPDWSSDTADRQPVFRSPGRVYRSQVSYHAPSKQYLLCAIIPGEDTRFEGGFGVYAAAEPWGPWTTLYYAAKWDMGPGETCSFPTKWMSEGAVHMLFSGEDAFSVRRARLLPRPGQ